MLSAGIGVPPPLPAAGAREARAKELCHDREPASDARVSHEDGTNLEIENHSEGLMKSVSVISIILCQHRFLQFASSKTDLENWVVMEWCKHFDVD